jgi:type II secretory pathway component PulJ
MMFVAILIGSMLAAFAAFALGRSFRISNDAAEKLDELDRKILTEMASMRADMQRRSLEAEADRLAIERAHRAWFNQ